MNWQERIIEEFNKEFTFASFTWNGDSFAGEKTAKQTKKRMEKFFLQEGEKIREETIEECKKQIFDVLFETYLEYDDAKRASNEILDKLKSDGEEGE